MPDTDRPVLLATRGSALALAQSNLVLSLCRAAFPILRFEIKIIKTTGDKLQTAPPDLPGMAGTKGLFTKELELAILAGEADLAVHSLKDLPTDLPPGLALCAVLPREDVRDMVIYRNAESGRLSGKSGLKPGASLKDFPPEATIATSSTRRQAQLLAARPDFKTVPIRGNVGTRLQKLADRADLHGLVLAAAGLKRLHFAIAADGQLGSGDDRVPDGLCSTFLSVDEMLPCVGQAAIGLEGRIDDPRLAPVLAKLNDPTTLSCVTAERSFLHAMGGGCLSPVAAYADLADGQLRLRAVSFRDNQVRRCELEGTVGEAVALGARAAAQIK